METYLDGMGYNTYGNQYPETCGILDSQGGY